MSTTEVTANGVDVTRLVETVGAIQSDPTLAAFRFRATNTWLSGGHFRTAIKGFRGAGTEDYPQVFGRRKECHALLEHSSPTAHQSRQAHPGWRSMGPSRCSGNLPRPQLALARTPDTTAATTVST